MADEKHTDEAAAEQAQQPTAQFQVQKIYVRDASLELPNAPQIFRETGDAEINMNLSQRVSEMQGSADGVHEVVLTVTVTAKSGDKTAYLAEVHQAGLFAIVGMDERQKQFTLNTLCPHILYPYACRVISGLVTDGGLPPLVLQPLSFEQIYAQRLQQASAASAEGVEAQGNA
ncbi:MAG: protein-export chaperone SecB [Xanthomonadales bacterium]|nr:protein-export chaperone SecB [Xanthomonadales bacterium]NIN60511.1 protein-export chaperone SecB [Xanthomonadales bacterium]NIN75866.1 protein-export chaperone SecB [Xanthomonadales bacterium]NIO15256.1 protein-export chaperone SecB [Xanthomonadales bacterium]NIP12904.1 protein-export chaperone SecB [Xanthomonadales bacterium]